MVFCSVQLRLRGARPIGATLLPSRQFRPVARQCPAPSDLRRGKELALPTLLEGGFWLDNRGINEHVAFLTYTYEEYSRLPKAPSMDELMAHLLDKQPLVDFRVCGRRADYDDIVSELNALIRRNGW